MTKRDSDTEMSVESSKKAESGDDSWPDRLFELVGSIDDETFEVPEELPWSLDSKRSEFD